MSQSRRGFLGRVLGGSAVALTTPLLSEPATAAPTPVVDDGPDKLEVPTLTLTRGQGLPVPPPTPPIPLEFDFGDAFDGRRLTTRWTSRNGWMRRDDGVTELTGDRQLHLRQLRVSRAFSSLPGSEAKAWKMTAESVAIGHPKTGSMLALPGWSLLPLAGDQLTAEIAIVPDLPQFGLLEHGLATPYVLRLQMYDDALPLWRWVGPCRVAGAALSLTFDQLLPFAVEHSQMRQTPRCRTDGFGGLDDYFAFRHSRRSVWLPPMDEFEDGELLAVELTCENAEVHFLRRQAGVASIHCLRLCAF